MCLPLDFYCKLCNGTELPFLYWILCERILFSIFWFSQVDRQRLMEKRTRMKQLRASVSSGKKFEHILNIKLAKKWVFTKLYKQGFVTGLTITMTYRNCFCKEQVTNNNRFSFKKPTAKQDHLVSFWL